MKHVQDVDTEVFQSCSEGLVYLTHMDRSVVKYYPGQLKLQMIEYQRSLNHPDPTVETRAIWPGDRILKLTKLTPAQRFMIGKRASEHGTTATVNHAPRYTTRHHTASIAITWSGVQ